MYELKVLNPEEWLNRCSRAWEGAAPLLEGLPSDQDSLLGSLALRLKGFEESLGSACALDPSDVFLKRQIWGSLKKFRFSHIDAQLRQREAMDKFEANNAIARTNHIPRRFQPGMQKVLRTVFRRYGRTLGTPRFGPGSVAEGYSILRRWDIAVADSSVYLDAPDDVDSNLVMSARAACRLHAVPKDFDKDRLITVEPSMNTLVQHTVRGSILNALRTSPDPVLRLLGYGTSSRIFELGGRPICDMQSLHQCLARQGSKDRTLATLDLKDASDLVSFEQVASVFPVEVVADLEKGRSTEYVRGSLKAPLFMFGGMGSACTFLVETLMFYSACHAIAGWYGIPFRDRHISVYGDDIICSTALASIIISDGLFSEFGWRVNETKSFFRPESAFRESCGGQFFDGHDVTILRYRGMESSKIETLVSFVDFMRRCCSVGRYLPLALPEWETTIPNAHGYRVDGGLLLSNPHWPRTDSTLRKRVSRRSSELQVLVQHPSPRYAYTAASGLGPVYGALSGQLAGQTVHRSRGGHDSVLLRLDAGDVAVVESWRSARPGDWWWY